MQIKSVLKKILPKRFFLFLKKIYSFIVMLKNILLYNLQFYFFKIYETKIKRNIKANKKIKIGFYVVYSSSWGARPLFELLQKDSRFEVKIVICPDTSRGIENQERVLSSTYKEFCEKYDSSLIISSFDESRKAFIDVADCFDLISIANPYDSMTHLYFTTKYLIFSKHKLVFFNSYGYQGKLHYDINLMKSDTYNLFWKFFVDNQQTYDLAKKYQFIHGKNIIVSGNCKMDLYSNGLTPNTKEKTVLICPHHTVTNWKGGLNLSNFLRFSALFLKLPKKYPQIKFIFRPHPLLFVNLLNFKIWSQEEIDTYLYELQENKNVVYSKDGEYFSYFKESSAMIDDCGSFLAEYFYTDKPQCYILQSDEQFRTEYLPFGQEFFNYVYKAYTEEDILNFIDTIVLKENDYLYEKRKEFAKNKVMINYPNVSENIKNYFLDYFEVEQ